jgi:hypothetical protein
MQIMKFIRAALFALLTVLPAFSMIIKPYYTAEHTYVNISRIVIIADIHDDLDRFKTILQNARIIDKNNEKADKIIIKTITQTTIINIKSIIIL